MMVHQQLPCKTHLSLGFNPSSRLQRCSQHTNWQQTHLRLTPFKHFKDGDAAPFDSLVRLQGCTVVRRCPYWGMRQKRSLCRNKQWKTIAHTSHDDSVSSTRWPRSSPAFSTSAALTLHAPVGHAIHVNHELRYKIDQGTSWHEDGGAAAKRP